MRPAMNKIAQKSTTGFLAAEKTMPLIPPILPSVTISKVAANPMQTPPASAIRKASGIFTVHTRCF